MMQNHHILTGINRGLRAQSASQLLASRRLTPPLNFYDQVQAAVDEAALEEDAEVAAEGEAAAEEAAEEEADEEEADEEEKAAEEEAAE